VDALNLRARVLATVHTGGKALGVLGGYVCGSYLLKDYLVNRCRHLIFTTALPPLVGASWLETVKRVRADEPARKCLHDNAKLFREMLLGANLRSGGQDYIVPIVMGDDARAVAAAQALQDAGFDVRAIRPPTVPAGAARLRVSIHADHQPRDLETLARAMAAAIQFAEKPLASKDARD
jgi:8-amino-7-oxononanoate synthase